jgi:D-serine deaminase-like pyridoxal phosphate-dependent protein
VIAADPKYAVEDTSSVFSPALLFYKDLIRRNIAEAVRIAGGPARLRPHVKTHKTPEVVRLCLDAGITKHKCATLAEAEMLAACGAPDVFVAYPLVGPNCGRFARLARAFPGTRFAAACDHPDSAEALSRAVSAEGQTVDVLLELDVGHHRTGLAPGPAAAALYEHIGRLPGLRPGGIHAYDGHNSQERLGDRESSVRALLEPVLALRRVLEGKGLPVPRLIAGGTPTFPVYAGLDVPGLECSPGTLVLHDHGYATRFRDLAGFTPAALLLTRVVSRPTPSRVTFDAGTKSVASDPPPGQRLALVGVPGYEPVLHNEEHFTVETPAADRYPPGAEVLAVPTHVCPTVALHRRAYVVEGGRVTGTWEVVARDRVLRY